jgi:hypothetical protein
LDGSQSFSVVSTKKVMERANAAATKRQLKMRVAYMHLGGYSGGW